MSAYRRMNRDGVTVSVHRAVWEAAHGPIPDGYVVHHRNGDKHDNRVENLELLTHADHARHHNDKHPRTKRCVVCGDEFTPHPTKRERAKTCGRECFRARMREVMSERRNHAKLTLAQYAEIRRRIASGERQSHLASEFGVSRSTITRVKQGTVV